jgi:hypothetical protein
VAVPGLVQLLCTFNPADLAMVRSVLDAEGITYRVEGEHFALVRPLVEPARVLVPEAEAEHAIDLLRHLDLAYLGIRIRA